MNAFMRVLVVAWIALFAPALAAETVHGKSSGRTKVTACANAKHDATRLCESTKVSSFKQCECEKVELANGDQFECSVDAVCEVPKMGGEALLSDPKRETQVGVSSLPRTGARRSDLPVASHLP